MADDSYDIPPSAQSLAMLAPNSPLLREIIADDRRELLADAPGSELEVEVVSDWETLAEREVAWRRLVETAMEPNAFFEPAILLPAMKHLAQDTQAEVLLVYAPNKANRQAPRVLCGLLPIQHGVPFRGWSLPGVATWGHMHCFLGTPLIRRDCGEATLHALFDWLADQSNSPAINLPLLHASGEFATTLTTVLQQRTPVWFVQKQIARSVFEPASDAETYMQQVWSRKTRHEARRQQRRLEELGDLTFRRLSPSDNINEWLDAFVELESRGWKGERGTAFECDENEKNFFIEALCRAFEEGNLQMLSLELDGQPIAMNTAFYSGEGGFYFKIAHDEAYRKYSPGVLLEAEFINVLHDRSELNWFDSCAEANHPMIERLWDRRRLMQSVWISNGRSAGDLFVALIEAAYRMKRVAAKTVKSIARYWTKKK